MIIKSAKNKSAHVGIKTRSALARKISDQTSYIGNNETVTDELSLTNCSSVSPDLIAKEMTRWADLNMKISDPTRHVVFSPEPGDRMLTRADVQRMIDIYRAERGLGDAPYYAAVQSDGHKDRHPQHVHFYFVRIKSDGKAVPDAFDATVHRAASRRIEKELGLRVNPGAAEKHKFNGRDRQTQRDNAAQRRGEGDWRVDPLAVQSAIDRSSNIKELRDNLRSHGIECRMRRRGNDVYAWALRNEGAREWTAGSKLTNGNAFGWKQVNDQLTANRVNQPRPAHVLHAQASSKHWPSPRPLPIRSKKKPALNAKDEELKIEEIEAQAQAAFHAVIALLRSFSARPSSQPQTSTKSRLAPPRQAQRPASTPSPIRHRSTQK